jgi:hypothetical protein
VKRRFGSWLCRHASLETSSNATGTNFFAHEVNAKRLGLMHDLLPKATRFALLVNPANATSAEVTSNALKEAGRALGLEILLFNTSTPAEIDAAFAAFAERRGDFNPHDSRAAQRTLRRGLTSHARSSSTTALQPPRCGPPVPGRPVVRSLGSRATSFAGSPGSQTTRSRPGARVHAPRRVACRYTESVGAPNWIRFVAQWLARPFPCQRFVPSLAGRHA